MALETTISRIKETIKELYGQELKKKKKHQIHVLYPICIYVLTDIIIINYINKTF